jgi:hypothetical protein
MHESVENVSMHAPQPERSIFMFLVETEEFLENRSQPSEQFEAGDGITGRWRRCWGSLRRRSPFPDDFEQFRTVVRDLAVLPQKLVDTLATLCGLGLKLVENIRLLMSNNWSSQSFLAMGRAFRVDVQPTSDTATHRRVVAGRERLDRSRGRHRGHHRPPGPCAGKGGSTLSVRRDRRDIAISQDEEKPLKSVGMIRFV